MTQPIPSESITYERYVDGLRRSNSSLLAESQADLKLFEFLEAQLNICTDNFESWRPKDTKAFLADLRHAVGKRDIAVRDAVTKPDGAPAPSTSAKTITIHLEGGMVADVDGIPAGVEVRVEDYDHGDDSYPEWDAEKECFVTVYGGDGV